MLKLENITVRFEKQTVIDNLSFLFEDGKAYAITGASGIGKTTLINAIAGLVHLSGGKIISDHKRIGYIFQEPRLFPWMTALENVECVCGDNQKAREYLELLLPESANKYPDELSGGMKQRVSIARALAYEPDVLLLDEPFKGLDEDTKNNVTDIVSKHTVGKTVILITHDLDDIKLCDVRYHIEASPYSDLVQVKSGTSTIE